MSRKIEVSAPAKEVQESAANVPVSISNTPISAPTNIPPWNPTPAPARPPERLSEDGAARTARELMAIWHAYGHTNVKAWTEPFFAHAGRGAAQTLYAVRTNLVGCLPPRVPQ